MRTRQIEHTRPSYSVAQCDIKWLACVKAVDDDAVVLGA
jgi:hypothetical protein